MRKLHCAIDGSKPSDKAFHWLVDNMYRDGDTVCLVHASEYKVDIGLPGAAVDVDAITKSIKEENDRIDNMIAGYMELLKKKNIQAYVHKVSGMKPGEAIVKHAFEDKANQIIMGSRGLGLFKRTFLGSVSEHVVHHAPACCAVTIIKDKDQ